jgi:hypothetical protein
MSDEEFRAFVGRELSRTRLDELEEELGNVEAGGR